MSSAVAVDYLKVCLGCQWYFPPPDHFLTTHRHAISPVW